MAFTEFYMQGSGSNLNAGSTADNSSVYTATNGAWDKDHDTNIGLFTPASGDPSASVSVGMFVSIYADASSSTGFVGRVTAVDSTTIHVSQTAKSGTVPSDAANGITCKAGGAWATPGFAIPFVESAMTDSAGNKPRLNLKKGSYTTTGNITQAQAGPIRFEHYNTAAGDLSTTTAGAMTAADLCTLDANNGNFIILTANGTNVDWVGVRVTNNATGTATGLYIQASEVVLFRCVADDICGRGFLLEGNNSAMIECEAFNCNTSNTASVGGITVTSNPAFLLRCISHDNTQANAQGFRLATAYFIADSCIADSNKLDGFFTNSTGVGVFRNCDAYGNEADGMELGNTSAGVFLIENCNFVNNTGYGINGSGAGARNGFLINCGFGVGTGAANGAGNFGSSEAVALGAMTNIGQVNYASTATPWTTPASGVFDISLATAKNAGRGSFLTTAASYGPTLGYPDIGAAQAQETGTAATTRAWASAG